MTDDIKLQPYRSGATRARVATWLLVAIGLVAVLAAVIGIYGMTTIAAAGSGSSDAGGLTVFTSAYALASYLFVALEVATAVAFLAWQSRAVDNVAPLGGGKPVFSPRWSIVFWFIPFANLFAGYEIIRDLSVRMRGNDGRRGEALIVAWWLMFMAAVLTAAVGNRLATDTPAEVIGYLRFDVAADVAYAIAAVLAIAVIRRIESRAAARADAIRDANDPSTEPFAPPPAKTSSTGATLAVAAGVTALLAAAVTAIAVLPTSSATAAQGTGVPLASQLPHEAADLEALLPAEVRGRATERWSVIGRDYFAYVGADTATIDAAESDLAAAGLSIDDVAFAVDGRSSESDPPYFIFALRFTGVDASTLATDAALDHPQAGKFTTDSLGGKTVRRGTIAMIDQTGHVRGLPYLYDSGDVRYIVVTDDPAWAADALRQLP
jgi:hypothetical protein